ncbi:hypothetical protein QL285_038762 [Trifolium repens]|nr:hypothetical protein QL285_038762 [Trifolium repens]
MDKEWTKLPRHWKRYRKGVKSFLDFAYTKGSPQGREISCPCAHCANGKWARRHVVRNHLIAAGFVEGYDVWVNHGEDMPLPMDVDKDTKDQQDSHDDIGGLLYDIFRDVREKKGGEVSQAEVFVETRKKSRKGKEVDGETQVAIDKLQESIEKSAEAAKETFHSLFGKERSGRVRCHGRTATPSSLRKKEEIALVKKQYDVQHLVETRKKSRKGKEVDGETQVAIDKLQESIEKSAEAAKETFHSLFGKERSGRVRCHGRTATPSSLRKKEEIALVKKQYDGKSKLIMLIMTLQVARKTMFTLPTTKGTWSLRLLALLSDCFVTEALNDISVLSWNIRGAHNNNSRRHMKEIIRKYHPTFLAILETHVPYAKLSSFWTNNGYTPIQVIEANGHSEGDFNETLIPSDQRGGIFQHARAALFANFMDQCNLLDLTTIGFFFTWHRNHNGLRILFKKLDRGLANVEWRLDFPEDFVDTTTNLTYSHGKIGW